MFPSVGTGLFQGPGCIRTGPKAPTQTWLKSSTTMATTAKATAKLEQAKVEYHSKAWLSAEQSAWESIAFFAQAIDLSNNETDRDEDLVAKTLPLGNVFAWRKTRSLKHATSQVPSLRRTQVNCRGWPSLIKPA